MISTLKFHLQRAKDWMKAQADKGRIEREFFEGDLVYLKLKPYRHISITRRKNHKLSTKYYGLYQVKKRIGKVAYELSLLEGSSIHPVIHVSQLKKAQGTNSTPTTDLVTTLEEPTTIEPIHSHTKKPRRDAVASSVEGSRRRWGYMGRFRGHQNPVSFFSAL